uniref:Ribosomal protein L13a n=1 Tax=Homo sapiens TaxID=9606 RepID=A0A7I2V376_HUMAN
MVEAISWAAWRPSWLNRYCWAGRWWSYAVKASTFLAISTETSVIPGFPPQADEHQPFPRPLPLPGPQPHLLADRARYAAPQNQARPGRSGPSQGV